MTLRLEWNPKFQGMLLAAAWVVVLSPAFSRAVTLDEIRAQVESNTGKIKTMNCEVEVTTILPTGSMKYSFTFAYKRPFMIKAVSLVGQPLVFISRRDTSFFKTGRIQKPEESLINMIRADKKGGLFNPLTFLEGDADLKVSPCGKNQCISFRMKPPKILPDSAPEAARLTESSGTMVFSPARKTIEKFDMATGQSSMSSVMEYQKKAGIWVPSLLTLFSGPTRSSVTFTKVKLNAPIDDSEFR